jgi:hypothetical protein
MNMVTVTYEHQFQYALDDTGDRYPRLSFRIAQSDEPEISVDVDAYLDCGAGRSLFNGRIGAALGIDVLSGEEVVFQATTGGLLVAKRHQVRLTHSSLGSFNLEVGFSTTDIHRNLLGRDFFDLAQIGFREHHLTFYVTPTP